MKKSIKALVIGMAAGSALFVSCGTTKNIAGTKPETYVSPDPVKKVEEPKEDEIDKVLVVDWTDRTLGEI